MESEAKRSPVVCDAALANLHTSSPAESRPALADPGQSTRAETRAEITDPLCSSPADTRAEITDPPCSSPADTRTAPTDPPYSSRAETREALAGVHASTFGWAMSCCRFDREEASDVLQASYLKILEGKARFNGASSLKTWVFGVVRRTAAERRRLRIVRDLALIRWARRRVEPEPARPPEILSEQMRVTRELRSLLGRLSARQRELLHLVFYEDMTIETAARTLGVSVGTARVHYQRGKAALRAMLETPGPCGMESAHDDARRQEHADTRRERSGDARAVPGCASSGRELGS